MHQDSESLSNFQQNKCFDVLDETTKDNLLQNRKALNTNRATKQWVDCLNQYLHEQGLGDIE